MSLSILGRTWYVHCDHLLKGRSALRHLQRCLSRRLHRCVPSNRSRDAADFTVFRLKDLKHNTPRTHMMPNAVFKSSFEPL